MKRKSQTSAVKTDKERSRWRRRYQAALRRYLHAEQSASLLPALKLGHEARVLGMETLDAAEVHEQTVAALAISSNTTAAKRTLSQSRKFFSRVVVALGQTHYPALKADARVDKLKQTLDRRTEEASEASRNVKRGIVKRRAAEAALKKSVRHHAKLLANAQGLQKHLQQLTHEILSAHENERLKISSQLRNKTGQDLLAVRIRLVELQAAIDAKTQKLEKDIDTTGCMLKESIDSFDRLPYKPRGDHDT